MTQLASRFGLLAGVAMIGAAQLVGCAPAPATRTVTSEVTTRTTPVPPPVVTTTTTEAVVPAPVRHSYVRRMRDGRGDIVSEETTETGSTTIVPATPPVQSTVTRTTSETIAPLPR